MKYYKFELKMWLANVISLLLFIIGFILLAITYPTTIEYGSYNMLTVLISLFLYLAIHEIIHGISFMFFCKDKRNVKYGAMLEKGVLYAMCQERISKKGIIISLLAPTLVLTCIAIIPAYIFEIDLLAMLVVFNLAGATGDLMMTAFVLRLPDDIKYIDYDNVIGFYLLSKKDLSKYNTKLLKFVESGKDSDKLINKKISPLYISKWSWIIISFLLICTFIYILFVNVI